MYLSDLQRDGLAIPASPFCRRTPTLYAPAFLGMECKAMHGMPWQNGYILFCHGFFNDKDVDLKSVTGIWQKTGKSCHFSVTHFNICLLSQNMLWRYEKRRILSLPAEAGQTSGQIDLLHIIAGSGTTGDSGKDRFFAKPSAVPEAADCVWLLHCHSKTAANRIVSWPADAEASF